MFVLSNIYPMVVVDRELGVELDYSPQHMFRQLWNTPCETVLSLSNDMALTLIKRS
jgi:hypothetical protein